MYNHYNYFKDYRNKKLFDAENGFLKGNMFIDIYDKLENYPDNVLLSTNENLFRVYNFALTDLAIYLDVNPDDEEVLKIYQDYLEQYQKYISILKKNGHYLTHADVPYSNYWLWLNTFKKHGDK